MTSFLAVTGFPPVCYRGRPPASPRFQGFFAECRPASGRPPVRNLVDPYIFCSHLSGLNFALGASYEFEPTFFGQAAGALVVLVMGCSEEVKISAVAVQAQDATNSGDALAVGLARYTTWQKLRWASALQATYGVVAKPRTPPSIARSAQHDRVHDVLGHPLRGPAGGWPGLVHVWGRTPRASTSDGALSYGASLAGNKRGRLIRRGSRGARVGKGLQQASRGSSTA